MLKRGWDGCRDTPRCVPAGGIRYSTLEIFRDLVDEGRTLCIGTICDIEIHADVALNK